MIGAYKILHGIEKVSPQIRTGGHPVKLMDSELRMGKRKCLFTEQVIIM